MKKILCGQYFMSGKTHTQTFRTMKITTVALFASAFSVYATGALSQSAKVSIQASQQSTKNVIAEIEKQTDYLFVYNEDEINMARPVSLNVKDQKVSDVLNLIFEDTNVSYRLFGKNISLIVKNRQTKTDLVQQDNMVKGTVVDQAGVPIIGANVVVKGTTTGTITDMDGNFSLNAPQGSVLLISYIGYSDFSVKVENQKSLSITLKEDSQNLEEVVVVGYGVQKKVNLTGSVSSVKGEELSLRPVSNATQSLQGLVPGLTVSNQSSGTPGSDSKLSLRGQGNLSNTADPYVLVDGVEMSLSDVNPNDIESISVLKDAAAAAIYGARAAYGVILVTTKRGKDGDMRVSYQGTVGWSTPTVLPEMVNGYEFAKYFNTGCINAGLAPQYSDEKLAMLKQYCEDPTGMDPWFELGNLNNLEGAFENSAKGLGNVDYFKLHYKDFAFKQNHNISLSGGSKKMQYYVSGGFYDEDGILRFADIGYKRLNFNANLNSQLTDWLKLKLNTKFVNADRDTPFGNGGVGYAFYHNLARFRPTVSPIDPHGNYTELTQIPYLQSGTFTERKDNKLTLNPGFEVEPIKNWKIFFDYIYRQSNSNYEALNVAPKLMGADGETFYTGTRTELNIYEKGAYLRSNSMAQYQSMNLYTNYMFSLKEKHNFIVLAGFQQEENRYQNMSTHVYDLISTSNPGLNLSAGDRKIDENRYTWATRGFFGRINYDFDGKYLLEFNGRYDGSSRFASGHRWGFFPSVSAGWNITRESFMQQSADVLNTLKLRASYGLLGNQSGAALYTFASTMGITPLSSYLFKDGRDMIINAPGVISPTTTWEKVKSLNVGLDFGFFNNSLTGTLDFFQRDTRDMLGPSADFADLFGAVPPKTNNACMRNRGWELTLQYRGNIGEDIKYTIGGSLADAVSKVTEYENPTGTRPDENWYVGKKVGEIWGYKTDGLIQTQAEADAYNENYNLTYLSSQKWAPGDLKYRDLNGDGKLNNGDNTLNDMGDKTIIGNNTPRYQYTINGGISWKGLSLSVMFQGVGKRDYSPNSGVVYFWGSGPYAQVTVFPEHLDYWTPENPDAYYPRPYTGGIGIISRYMNKTALASDRYMQSAAYCRLKNLTISYELPKAWTQKIGLSQTRVFFSGENLLTFTKLANMFDPEVIFSQNAYSSGDGKNYPMNRVLSVGVNVNF